LSYLLAAKDVVVQDHRRYQWTDSA
jgi:hypothetical protein